MALSSHICILPALFLLISINDYTYSKSITDRMVNQKTREKRGSGCCQDNDGHNNDGGNGGGGGGGCCLDNEDNNQGGCCQDDDKGGHEGGCCQNDDQGDHGDGNCCQVNNAAHGNLAKDGCCQHNANDPSTYGNGNIQPNECSHKEGHSNTPPKEETMMGILDELFVENVKKADENTLLLFSTMLNKLQSHMQNLKVLTEEIHKSLHLRFQSFDNWTMHTDRVIDSAISVVQNCVHDV